QGRAGRAAQPDPRPAPGRPRGPRPGRGPVRDSGAAADPGPADRGRAAPAAADDRGGGLLRGLRGPDQHHQARPGQPGGGGGAAGRRAAAQHHQRRRRGRRRPGPRHRPGRPGQARRVGRRDLRDRQPARRADPADRGPAMRAVAGSPVAGGSTAGGTRSPPGRRWIWTLIGLATVVALAVPIIRAITTAGDPQPDVAYAQPVPTSTRTIVVTQPVTSVTVLSYGSPVQVTTGSVSQVEVTEAAAAPVKGQGPWPVPVTQTWSGGHLLLAD